MGSQMKQQLTIQEIHASICGNIKTMYAKKGEQLTNKEAIEATNNLLRFCGKIVEIRSREEKI